MIMTSVLGHVKELDFSPEYGNWSLTPPDSLFDAQVLSKVADVSNTSESIHIYVYLPKCILSHLI